MEESTFWLRLWQSIIAGVVLIALCIGGCSSYQATKISEAIASGVDPISAGCAIRGSNERDPICVLKAAGTDKKY